MYNKQSKTYLFFAFSNDEASAFDRFEFDSCHGSGFFQSRQNASFLQKGFRCYCRSSTKAQFGVRLSSDFIFRPFASALAAFFQKGHSYYKESYGNGESSHNSFLEVLPPVISEMQFQECLLAGSQTIVQWFIPKWIR